MKKTRFLITLMLVLALVVSCLHVVSLPAFAKSNYVGFSITKGAYYYHNVKNLFAFENRTSETFEKNIRFTTPPTTTFGFSSK